MIRKNAIFYWHISIKKWNFDTKMVINLFRCHTQDHKIGVKIAPFHKVNSHGDFLVGEAQRAAYGYIA